VLRQEKAANDLANEIQRTRPNDTFAQNGAVPVIQALVDLFPVDARKASPEKAIDLLNTALLYARANTGVLFIRGLAYKQSRHYAEAQQDFQKVMDLKARNSPSRNWKWGGFTSCKATLPKRVSPIRISLPRGRTRTPTCPCCTKSKRNTQSCNSRLPAFGPGFRGYAGEHGSAPKNSSRVMV
jgi:tetratricopeptide (TPR) repeat protein